MIPTRVRLRALRSITVLVGELATARPAAAQPAAPEPLPDDAVLALAGAYRATDGALVALSLQRTPFGALPLRSDVRTGALRVHFPAGRDSFVAGPELARPEPVW